VGPDVQKSISQPQKTGIQPVVSVQVAHAPPGVGQLPLDGPTQVLQDELLRVQPPEHPGGFTHALALGPGPMGSQSESGPAEEDIALKTQIIASALSIIFIFFIFLFVVYEVVA